MHRLLKVMLLSSTTLIPISLAHAQDAPADPSTKGTNSADGMPALPPAPGGKSTILGGQIRNVDPVLDRFVLRAYGEKPIKIYFDARTQVFRDGNPIPLGDLGPEEHASVQTVLDGSNVYAITIHMLSKTPQGDLQGNVEDFDPATGRLTVKSSLTREPVRLDVRPDTQIVRQGQSAFTAEHSGQNDLVAGAMVSIVFQPTKQGHGVASRITVLATPGASFVFSGDLTALDVTAGRLVLVDPRDQKTYQISFDAARMPNAATLHTGDHVRVTASFDGTHYVASEITTY